MVSPQSVASQNVEVGRPSGQVMTVSAGIGQPQLVGGVLPAQPSLQQGRSESSKLKSSQQLPNAQPTELAPQQPTMSRSGTDEVTGSRTTLLGSRNRDGDLVWSSQARLSCFQPF